MIIIILLNNNNNDKENDNNNNDTNNDDNIKNDNMKHSVCRFGSKLSGETGQGFSVAWVSTRPVTRTASACPPAHGTLLPTVHPLSLPAVHSDTTRTRLLAAVLTSALRGSMRQHMCDMALQKVSRPTPIKHIRYIMYYIMF